MRGDRFGKREVLITGVAETGLDISIEFWICSVMREPPYDRSLALAAQIQTMRDHYLDVSCGCGDRRVIALGVMARNRKIASATLAHVALRITCHGCRSGPDEVYLCATVYGREPPTVGGRDAVWMMPLVTRERQPSYHLRDRG